MRLRPGLLTTTMLTAIAGGMCSFSHTAKAADLNLAPLYARTPWAPAVDGFNAKWDGLGGELDHKSLYGSRASFSVPLGGQLGLQIDGGGGSLDNRGFGTVGGHLFTRNPAQGLLGIYSSYTSWDQFGGVHATHVAGEGELYLGRWTVQAIAGAEFGNSASNISLATTVVLPGAINTNTLLESYDVRTRFMDQVNLKYYFTDNWDGYVGHRYLGGKNALALGSEVGLGLGRGLMGTAFVEARVGETSFEGVWGGLRFYFGQRDKTLIRRHREDDPIVWDTLFTLLNNHNQSTSQTSIPVVPPCTGDNCGPQ